MQRVYPDHIIGLARNEEDKSIRKSFLRDKKYPPNQNKLGSGLYF